MLAVFKDSMAIDFEMQRYCFVLGNNILVGSIFHVPFLCLAKWYSKKGALTANNFSSEKWNPTRY